MTLKCLSGGPGTCGAGGPEAGGVEKGWASARQALPSAWGSQDQWPQGRWPPGLRGAAGWKEGRGRAEGLLVCLGCFTPRKLSGLVCLRCGHREGAGHPGKGGVPGKEGKDVPPMPAGRRLGEGAWVTKRFWGPVGPCFPSLHPEGAASPTAGVTCRPGQLDTW